MAVYVPVRPRWNPRGVVINYVFNGQLCVRSWPKGYRDADTAAQRQQRGKMAQVCGVLPYLKALLAVGYSAQTKRNGRRVGGYHAAVATALREWFVETPRGARLDTSRLRLTDGIRSLPEGLRAERAGEALRVAWASAAGRRGATLLLAVQNPTANQWVSLPIALEEDAADVTVRLPKAWSGQGVEVWVAFVGRGKGEKTKTYHAKMGAPTPAVPSLPTSRPPNGGIVTARVASKGPGARPRHRVAGPPPGSLCACIFHLRALYCIQKE